MSSIEEKNEQQANAAFWAKQPDIASLPTQVTIVSSNQCNFRCAMCPYHGDPQHIIRDKADRFPLDLVDKLQAYINTAAHFSLSGFSEAFASAYYFELLDYIVKKTNISSTRKLSVVTNASIFDEKKAAYLLELAKEIHFSIDGLDQGAYFTLRGFDLDKTMDNMRKFYALRSRLGLDNEVFYSVDSIVTPQNIASMPKFIRLFSQEMPVNRLSVFPLHVIPPAYARQWTVQRKNGGLFCYADAMITEDNVRKYSDFVDEIYAAKEKYGGGGTLVEIYGALRRDQENIAPICWNPWNFVYIYTDGDVAMCCGAADTRKAVGNLRRESFENIWFKGMGRARRDFARGLLPPICRGAGCPYDQRPEIFHLSLQENTGKKP